MNTYRLRLKHDYGTFTLRVAAQTEERAKEIVMKAERCPERAIKSIVDLGRTMYKVVKIYRKSSRREIVERNLTMEQAQRLVNSFPDSQTHIVCFMKMGGYNYES